MPVPTIWSVNPLPLTSKVTEAIPTALVADASTRALVPKTVVLAGGDEHRRQRGRVAHRDCDRSARGACAVDVPGHALECVGAVGDARRVPLSEVAVEGGCAPGDVLVAEGAPGEVVGDGRDADRSRLPRAECPDPEIVAPSEGMRTEVVGRGPTTWVRIGDVPSP